MPDVSFTSLSIITAVAFVSRLLLGFTPRVRIPGVVVEIVLGIVIGPSVLGWVEVDEPVEIVALVGLTFVLFLSGLELDLRMLRGSLLRAAAGAMVVSIVLAVAIGFSLDAAGLVTNPMLIAVTLLATSLGLVVPVAKEGGFITSRLGQLVIAGATLGDFLAIVLLSLLFSRDSTETSTRLVLLGGFAVLVVIVIVSVTAATHSRRISDVLVRLQDTTAQVRVRGAIALVMALVVVAEHTGLETILGAFVAGALISTVDRDTMHTHPLLAVKLEAIGYGFLIPVFFITSGVRFDLDSLVDDTSALALVPIFLAAMLVARGVPAILYRREIGSTRGTIAAALLQATSLPVIVTATSIGVAIGALSTSTASAFVAAGLLSALIFPAAALAILRGEQPTLAPTRVMQRSAI